MIQSEKLRNKVIESTHQPPHENLLLVDLPGEEWKPFPIAPFDEGYAVSNKGRVKRIEHTITRKNGFTTKLRERVLTQYKHYYFNRYLKEQICHLVSKTHKNDKGHTFQTSRLVYYAFVAPFDLDDSNLIVRHKDGNRLNCVPENLYLSERKKLVRSLIDLGRRDPLGSFDRSKFSTEEIERWYNTWRKMVSQYDMDGKFIRNFNSRAEAAKFIGVDRALISAVIRGKSPTAGGFLWREGSSNSPKQIDVPHIIQHVKVAKYNLQGELITVYSSIAEAARNVNLSTTVVSRRIYGRIPHNRFILKAVDEKKTIPVRITVELAPEKVFNSKKHGIPEGSYPFQNLSLNDLSGEIWKKIPDKDGIYWISNWGRVKSAERMQYTSKARYLKSARIMCQLITSVAKTKQVFLLIVFNINKKPSSSKVSYLVYRAFIGEIPRGYLVVCKDNDPLNCRVENLELKSLSDLRKHLYKQGLIKINRIKKPVAQYTLDGKHIATYPSLTEAGQQTGFSCGKISECANGKRKTHRGFLWKYIQSEKETKYKSDNVI